jgi:hypothetical protein
MRILKSAEISTVAAGAVGAWRRASTWDKLGQSSACVASSPSPRTRSEHPVEKRERGEMSLKLVSEAINFERYLWYDQVIKLNNYKLIKEK